MQADRIETHEASTQASFVISTELRFVPFSAEVLNENNKITKFYTGLPSWQVFDFLVCYLSSKLVCRKKLSVWRLAPHGNEAKAWSSSWRFVTSFQYSHDYSNWLLPQNDHSYVPTSRFSYQMPIKGNLSSELTLNFQRHISQSLLYYWLLREIHWAPTLIPSTIAKTYSNYKTAQHD